MTAACGQCRRVDELVAKPARDFPLDVKDPAPALGALSPLGHVGLTDRIRDDEADLAAQTVDGSREGGGELLLAPDPVKVNPLTRIVREPRDGVGDDVRAEALEALSGDDLFGVTEQDRFRDQPLAVEGIDAGGLIREPDHELAEVLLSAEADDVRELRPRVLELRYIGF